jgi:hypothetical protein
LYYDSLLPNPYYVKVHTGWAATTSAIEYAGEFVANGGYWVLGLALVAVPLLARDPGVRRSLVVVMAVVSAQLAFLLLTGRDDMPGHRFVLTIVPILCALASVALGRLARVVTAPRAADLLAIGIALAIAVGEQATQSRALRNGPRRFWLEHSRPWKSYLGASDLRGTWLEGHQATGEYLKQHARPGDLLLVMEAGVIPFYAELETIDLLGLTDREIPRIKAEERIPRPPGTTGRALFYTPALPERLTDRLLRLSPRWVVLDGSMGPPQGRFVPRLVTGKWLIEHPEWDRYQRVFAAPVYDGAALGLGPDRINVIFERTPTGP